MLISIYIIDKQVQSVTLKSLTRCNVITLYSSLPSVTENTSTHARHTHTKNIFVSLINIAQTFETLAHHLYQCKRLRTIDTTLVVPSPPQGVIHSYSYPIKSFLFRTKASVAEDKSVAVVTVLP